MADEFLKKAIVTIACGTEGATIHYTTDGNDATAESAQYSAPFDLWQNATIKAIGVKEGMMNSDIATQEYTIKLPTPVLQADVDGDVSTITITNVADFADHYGTVIYHYTDDGNEPDNDSPEFTSGMTFTKNCTVKVIATATNNVNSASGSVTISTVKVDTPVITAVAG